jgi:hypothetical protein
LKAEKARSDSGQYAAGSFRRGPPERRTFGASTFALVAETNSFQTFNDSPDGYRSYGVMFHPAPLSIALIASTILGSFAEPSFLDRRFFDAMAAATPAQTKAAGGSGGGEFYVVGDEGGVLIGFDLWIGSYGGHTVISAICPIFQNASGVYRGRVCGTKRGSPTTVQAYPGYAVQGIHIRSGHRVDGIDVIFWKIDYAHLKLTGNGGYKSQLVGGEGGSKRRTPLAGGGRPVIGIYGGCGAELDRLGLVYSTLR